MRAFPAFLLAMLAVPHLATAAVAVADPTGDADPAFLAELKASLETVAAEAPASLAAELRSSATVTDADVALVVELVPSDGSAPVRETRIVSKASALSQARAMARAAIESFNAPAGVATTATKVVVVQEKSAAPRSAPLPQKYDRRKALRMTVLQTVLFPVGGVGIFSLGFLARDGDGFFICTIIGSIFTAYGLIIGPSTGYFYVGRGRHALAMMGLRVGTLATSVVSAVLWVSTSTADVDEPSDSQPMWLVMSILSATALVLSSIIDAAFVGRAADHANALWRESQKIKIQVAPVAWSDGNGQRTYGLALSGSF